MASKTKKLVTPNLMTANVSQFTMVISNCLQKIESAMHHVIFECLLKKVHSKECFASSRSLANRFPCKFRAQKQKFYNWLWGKDKWVKQITSKVICAETSKIFFYARRRKAKSETKRFRQLQQLSLSIDLVCVNELLRKAKKEKSLLEVINCRCIIYNVFWVFLHNWAKPGVQKKSNFEFPKNFFPACIADASELIIESCVFVWIKTPFDVDARGLPFHLSFPR